jgi:SAM-dependent methyltransferase
MSMRSGHSDLTAEVYDLSHPVGGSYGDVDYHVGLLSGIGGKVLELACGNGRILIPALRAGVHIEGLDHSAAMLEFCRSRAEREGFWPHLFVADMADFSVPRPYDVIVAAAGVVKELAGRETALRCLASSYSALRPGGRLIVDLVPQRNNSLAVATDRPSTPAPLRYWRQGDVMWTVETVLLDYDSSVDRTVALRRYEKWDRNRLVATELHEFYLQHWTPAAFSELLVEAGFVVDDVVADYLGGKSPGPKDKDWTFHARRP